jgi:hypothetical protein
VAEPKKVAAPKKAAAKSETSVVAPAPSADPKEVVAEEAVSDDLLELLTTFGN